METSKEIYRPYGTALGDCWLNLNYLINLAIRKNEVLRTSLWYLNHGKKLRRADKCKEILPLFKYSNYIELGEWEPTEWKIPWQQLSKYPIIPTTITWSPNNSKKICYQLDAKSKKGQAFPSKDIENELLDRIGQNYELVKLGLGKTLKQCVEDLATCEIFVGVDSGMGHMAASVGTPIFYCQNNRDPSCWSTVHSNKTFVVGKDYLETIEHINNYKKEGLNYHDRRRYDRSINNS
jgi:hypothetical protein